MAQLKESIAFSTGPTYFFLMCITYSRILERRECISTDEMDANMSVDQETKE
jgi:hypothetical protein